MPFFHASQSWSPRFTLAGFWLTVSYGCIYKLSLQFWRIQGETGSAVRAMLFPLRVLEKWPPLFLPNVQKIPVFIGLPDLQSCHSSFSLGCHITLFSVSLWPSLLLPFIYEPLDIGSILSSRSCHLNVIPLAETFSKSVSMMRSQVGMDSSQPTSLSLLLTLEGESCAAELVKFHLLATWALATSWLPPWAHKHWKKETMHFRLLQPPAAQQQLPAASCQCQNKPDIEIQSHSLQDVQSWAGLSLLFHHRQSGMGEREGGERQG